MGKPIQTLYTVDSNKVTDEYYYHCKGIICKHKRNFTFIEPAEIGEQFISRCYFCSKMITFEVVKLLEESRNEMEIKTKDNIE